MDLSLDLGALWSFGPPLLLAGLLIGLLAGLFGVGGGAISVPVFFEVFRLAGVDPAVQMPLAVGSSLAMIIPTAILSTLGHARRGAVDFDLLRAWILPVLAGVALGTLLARSAPPELFQVVFALVAFVVAMKLLTGSALQLRDDLPGPWLTRLYGAVVGFLAFLMGVGGGAISNLVLTLHGRTIHSAVATSAGVGVLIAVPGTLGYILAGWGRPDLPPDAIGFVSLFALILTMPTALIATRLGVRIAHVLSKRALSRAFGLFLLVVCLRFVVAIVFGS